ncbi:hypothetical protein TSACC_21006 [Terrimicrobium sacchariphilum]|uniref:Glycosyl hydrolase 94 catalytic domain-containing protein n=1 Tax=Terrimicrobium sacchariphilum TaxID=690879 RepID=A0A146G6P9_TERSA|nr:hypothetical protein [Terrimicrobium sacchariphilum]GAT32607.1 hypothetical protein TSACC_21006 [Terrimicrobium sacchariphilum]
MRFTNFSERAEKIHGLPLASPVSSHGGYGPGGEVIYTSALQGCPGVFVAQEGHAMVTVQTNGSTHFRTLLEQKEIPVLKGSFDPVVKRETGLPSHNVWLRLESGEFYSLINPVWKKRDTHRVIKTTGANRAIWFAGTSDAIATAVEITLAMTPHGPALVRRTHLKNTGTAARRGQLWSSFHVHGTQFFSYNKDNWYDAGLPVTDADIVVACPVPFTEIHQIKRLAQKRHHLQWLGATCDYQSFVGSSAASALWPEAVARGGFLPEGAGERLNRFSTPTLAATAHAWELAPGESASLEEHLLFVENPEVIAAFRQQLATDEPGYTAAQERFRVAATNLIESTGGMSAPSEASAAKDSAGFFFNWAAQPAVSRYANSLWATVDELYENCRAHGSPLADGIEVGSRDRAQDMWVKMRNDPARVRADLVHAFGLMIRTSDRRPIRREGIPLTIVEKLHGTFPRQYPSRWLDRTKAVHNDNRPYADSSLWLLNALSRYIRQTGDLSILDVSVPSVRLLSPGDPVNSTMIGNDTETPIAEVVAEIFENIRRSAEDSPYGMVQILYGDWCDPIDMFGTSIVGAPGTRGNGRGVNTRLTAHAVEAFVEMLDILALPVLRSRSWHVAIHHEIQRAREMANQLRLNAIRWAWEGDNFVDSLHELRVDGTTPDYHAGESGYTLGSARGRDFDGRPRRVVTANAYGIKMLTLEREYLTPIAEVNAMIRSILSAFDRLWDSQLGLPLIAPPVANNPTAIRLVGRMGMLPPGTAENGEYHHGQIFMHSFRRSLPGETMTSFQSLAPVLSVLRKDDALGGPFDSPANSYASDKDDPHYGNGMNFGLSGSTAWLVEYFEGLAGVTVDLSDPDDPWLRIDPAPLQDAGDVMEYIRLIHWRQPDGSYASRPVHLIQKRDVSTLNGRDIPVPHRISLKSWEDHATGTAEQNPTPTQR